MLLMTDVLVFLQEKDQKYIFPALVRPSSSFSSMEQGSRPCLLFCLSPEEPWNPPEFNGNGNSHHRNRIRNRIS